MEIEIISRENIKPSSPTPSHLRNYKLSLLDQHSPSKYIPMLLVYPQNTTDHHLTSRRKLQLLKVSLSKTLSQFYPFAGKFKDRLTIDCNDEGAYFAEARVKAHMTEGFLKHPNFALLQRFLPGESSSQEAGPRCHVSMFQVNLFDCGGIVIAVAVSHKIADGTAINTFLKSWAAIASGSETESLSPSYISSSLFPQSDIRLGESMSPYLKKGKSITKRFTFNAESLSALKAKATNMCNGQIPTRVQSVTALIWKSFIATLTSLSAAQKPPFVIHAVDIRRRASPPFSESCMGNWIWGVLASCKDECGTELDQLVGEINNAIKKVNVKFVKQLEGESGAFKFYEALIGKRQQIEKEAADCLVFTSWYNFGLYKVDFGWGKPELVTTTLTLNNDSTCMNAVLLKETKDGEGMEALVNLSEQEMAIFERETELLRYAVVDGDGAKLDGESG